MICTYCKKRRATQYHHQFSNSVENKKYYTQKELDNPINRKPACTHCNVSHAGLNLVVWNEFEYCDAMNIVPRSKTAQARIKRERKYK